MKVWRFHREIYGPLDTTGSFTYGGRWNPKGTPVLYTSLTFAGGLLELLAHSTAPRRPPRDHVAWLIEIPDSAGITVLRPPYPTDWDHPDDYRVSLNLARPWLVAGTDLCLEVPSVPGSPIERNVIINASHPMFKQIVLTEKVGPIYDARVWG